MVAQPIFTPEIEKCWCGAPARPIDWDFKMRYQVMCDNNHTLSKECNTKHRAICKWNNRVKIKKGV